MSTEQNSNEDWGGGSGLNAGLGEWTLISPNGRIFKADTPLKCCALEMRERVPAEVALARIQETITCKTCGDKLVGHEDESDTECRWCVTGWKPCKDTGVPMTPNAKLSGGVVIFGNALVFERRPLERPVIPVKISTC